MSFKDIEFFNKALLAKQAWRILYDQSSILSCFLKSRYFPNGDFLSASIGNRPSYAWRNILHGRDLLAKGLRHMIDNGLSISVWTMPWLVDGGKATNPSYEEHFGRLKPQGIRSHNPQHTPMGFAEAGEHVL